MRLSLADLSERTGLTGRAIRFYIQRGLLPRPHGEKRGAYYDDTHLASLLRLREWQKAGLSLDAIGELLSGSAAPPVSTARAGAVEVRSHLLVADGIELVVAPDRARLSQQQIRSLFREVQAAYDKISAESNSSPDPQQPEAR